MRRSKHSADPAKRRIGRTAAALAALLAGAAPAARASITGVCPDGSVFIVQRAESIPCANAKRVDPSDVPPLKPEFLPRPYAWEVFNQQQDANNPYNLIDAAQKVRDARGEAPEAAPAGDTARATEPQTAAASRPLPAPPQAPAGEPTAAAKSPALGLSDEEARDLALIVDLSQQRAPAAFSRDQAGAPTLAVRVAPSAAFEQRLREAWSQQGLAQGGPVLLFTAQASAPEVFYPNFTFVQGHQAFHPDPGDATQLGLIRGDFGELAPGAGVLGYVVLPEQVELGRPLDIYWDDRQLTATLRP